MTKTLNTFWTSSLALELHGLAGMLNIGYEPNADEEVDDQLREEATMQQQQLRDEAELRQAGFGVGGAYVIEAASEPTMAQQIQKYVETTICRSCGQHGEPGILVRELL